MLQGFCIQRTAFVKLSKGNGLSKLNISPDISSRLLAFVNAEVFATRSNVAKSEYWKYFGDQLRANIGASSVVVMGRSGFYVPEQSGMLKRVMQKAVRAVRQPLKAVNWVHRAIESRFAVPRLMSYEQAFNAVMNSWDVSVPINSAFTINHRGLAGHPKAFTSAASIKRHYENWSGYEASANILKPLLLPKYIARIH